MTENKDIAETPKKAVAEARETPLVLQPPVDICEDADGITLVADMPGVSRERLTIQVDKDTLSIEGEARIDMPEGMKPLYADIRSTRYRRSFALSGELDAAHDVRTVSGLGIEPAANCEHLGRAQVEQLPHQGGGAQVDGDAEHIARREREL